MNTNANRKITEALELDNLKNRFYIGTVVIDGKPIAVNGMARAIETGELQQLFQECADQLYDGNIYEVYNRMSKNLSNWRTVMNKRGYTSSSNSNDWVYYDLLRKFVDDNAAEHRTTGHKTVVSNKTMWQLTVEEIDAIDDLATITSIYNVMASKKSKYPDLVKDNAQFNEAYKFVSEKKSKLLAAAKVDKKNAEEHLSQELIEKINAGGKVTLSVKQAAELMELLKSYK